MSLDAKHIVLASGGLDSAATMWSLHQSGKVFDALFVHRTGVQSVQQAQEYFAAVTQYRALTGADLPRVYTQGFLTPGTEAHEPFRNLQLAAMAAAYSRSKTGGNAPIYVYVSGVKDDKVGDKTPQAFDAFSSALTACGLGDVTVTSLWWNVCKFELLPLLEKTADDLEAFRSYFGTVFSCYNPRSVPSSMGGAVPRMCGNCSACVRLYVATYKHLQLRFNLEPRTSDAAEKMLQRMNDGGYDESRVAATWEAILSKG